MSKRIYLSDQAHEHLKAYAESKGLPIQVLTEMFISSGIMQEIPSSWKHIDLRDFLKKHLKEMQVIWKEHFKRLGGMCDGAIYNFVLGEMSLEEALEENNLDLLSFYRWSPSFPYTPPEQITDANELAESIVEGTMIRYGYIRFDYDGEGI